MKKIAINKQWCKTCGICIKFCPKNVLSKDADNYPAVENEDDCTGCRLCEMRCPDFAIKVVESV